VSEASKIGGLTGLAVDVPEIWSLPWHALQRTLAAGFNPNSSAHCPARAHSAAWPAPALRFADPFRALSPVCSWLGRARARDDAGGAITAAK
jgi:hypothetical protein